MQHCNLIAPTSCNGGRRSCGVSRAAAANVRRCSPNNHSSWSRAAPAASANTPSTSTATWQLYTGRMPLIGLEPVAALLDKTPLLRGTPVSMLLYLHTYLLLEGPNTEQSGVWYLDFLPLAPTSPGTALPLLTGGRVPGEVRVRKLGVQQVKAQNGDKVRLLGPCLHPDPLLAVEAFNRDYDTSLHLLLNNCMHYTNGLSRALLTDDTEA